MTRIIGLTVLLLCPVLLFCTIKTLTTKWLLAYIWAIRDMVLILVMPYMTETT